MKVGCATQSYHITNHEKINRLCLQWYHDVHRAMEYL